jgi:hypothetical protein
MTNQSVTAKDAAAEIIALINSRAQSPWPQEIEAVIARISPASSAVSGHALTCTDRGQLAQWDSILRQHVADTKKACDDDAECDRLDNLLAATCEALWAQPVQSLDDVFVRLAVCVHWNSPLHIGDPAYPNCAVDPAPVEGGDMDSRALAYLVRGLLDLTGLRFDQDGRLLSRPEQRPREGETRLAQLRKAIAAIEAAADAAGPPRQWTHDAIDRIDALNKPLCALADAVWATPVRSLSDLQERALIARHWFREKRCDDGENRIWQHPSEVGDWGEQTIAELIHSVLQLMPDANDRGRD